MTPEECVLGTVLVYPEAYPDIDLVPGDFLAPSHQELWAAMGRVHASGRRPDTVTMAVEMGDDRDWPVRLVTLQGCAHYTGLAGHVRAVREATARRRLGAVAEEMLDHVRSGADPAAIIDHVSRAVATVELPSGDTAGLAHAAEFTVEERPEAPWVVPGLLREGWRVMFIAGEGIGKSVLTNQVAVCAARGVHPFTAEDITPRRALIVDLENPDDVVASRLRRLQVPSEAPCWVWHRPEGINLRSRTARAQLEAVLDQVRPEIVSLGPLYKATARGKGETYEDAAADLQQVLDAARTRWGFALMLEHHAPHGSGVGPRDMRPEGSSLWRRWPELGLTLTAVDGDRRTVDVGRFREDRVVNQWPERLKWGRGLPWVTG